MKRLLVAQLPASGSTIDLPDDEAHHVVQVLRARNGEEVELLDGRGSFVRAALELQGKGRAQARALAEPSTDARLRALPIRLEMAVLKGDAMEWTIEKAVELGVRDFVPLLTAHGVVQIDKKGPESFRERWQKQADQALKQCGRLERMTVHLPSPLEIELPRFTGVRFWFDEAARASSPSVIEALAGQPGDRIAQGVALLVGPEGGWSANERALLARSAPSVSLGPWVLRAETAALFATGLVAASMR